MFLEAAPVCVISAEMPSASRTVEEARADEDEAEADLLEALERDMDRELAEPEGEATVVDCTGVDEAEDTETDELGRAVELLLTDDEALTATRHELGGRDARAHRYRPTGRRRRSCPYQQSRRGR